MGEVRFHLHAPEQLATPIVTGRDLVVLRALAACPVHWKVDEDEAGGFLPVQIVIVLASSWTFQGLRVALKRLRDAGLVRPGDGERWRMTRAGRRTL